MTIRRDSRINVSESAGEVSAHLLRPRGARRLLVLGHGAGAGMHHPFLEAVAEHLAGDGIATFRYQFPYMERGSKRPDARSTLLATVRAAAGAAAREARGLPMLAGGKSMGGRMTSLAAAEEALPGVRGLVFLGFPLHRPGHPGRERAEHLPEVDVPMLFLQGTRDTLAEIGLIRQVTRRLGKRAHLHVVDGGDHSFHVLKRSGRTDEEVLKELTGSISAWALGLPT